MTHRYFSVILISIMFLIVTESLWSQRNIKFDRIGQRERVKMGEKYNVIFGDVNPENSRIRYIPSPKEGEYFLELTHYTGLEKDAWIGETIKKYENEIKQLKTQNQELSEQNRKSDNISNNKTETKNHNVEKANKSDESNKSKVDYSLLNLSPLTDDIDKKSQEITRLDNQIAQNTQEYEQNQLKIEALAKGIKSLEKDPKNSAIVKVKQAELESLLKRNIELSNANNSLYKEKIKLLNDKHSQEQELANQIRIRNIFILISIAIFAVSIVLFYNYKQKKLANKILTLEKQKSDKLLLNILPNTIAERLKTGEKMIADRFESASVIFIDISHFTDFSKKTKPEEIVSILNRIYTEFDHIAIKYGLEKIKTIGDCYMAAAGLPVPQKNHAELCAKFAIEAMQKIDYFETGLDIKLRIKSGIDCGSIVAGIIGESKFIYDIWGDTVNTASRMEEYSEPGKIQITEKFKNTLINYLKSENRPASSFHFEERGEQEIKGLGLMKTWFLKD